MSIPAIITAATLARVETDFLELNFIDASMSLCHYADNGVYKWPFRLNAQDFRVSLDNNCPENAEPISTL